VSRCLVSIQIMISILKCLMNVRIVSSLLCDSEFTLRVQIFMSES